MNLVFQCGHRSPLSYERYRALLFYDLITSGILFACAECGRAENCRLADIELKVINLMESIT